MLKFKSRMFKTWKPRHDVQVIFNYTINYDTSFNKINVVFFDIEHSGLNFTT